MITADTKITLVDLADTLKIWKWYKLMRNIYVNYKCKISY